MSDDAGRPAAAGRFFDASFLRPTRAQLLVLALSSPIVFGLAGPLALASWMSGGLCAVIPQGYFAWRMGRAARSSAAAAARQGLAAEGGKFLLSAVSFALVFAVVKPTHPGLVFLGFAAQWLTQTISAARLALQPRR